MRSQIETIDWQDPSLECIFCRGGFQGAGEAANGADDPIIGDTEAPVMLGNRKQVRNVKGRMPEIRQVPDKKR